MADHNTPVSLGGSCKHTTSCLRSTPVPSPAMVHSNALAQLCWITLIIGYQGSRFSLSRSRSRNLGLSDQDVSPLSRWLLFLRISLLLPSAICCPSSPRSETKHHSIRPSSRVGIFVRGRPFCCAPVFLLCRATLQALLFFAHLLLNAI
jgi:hypothetical protein